jgi:hypothetical protein
MIMHGTVNVKIVSAEEARECHKFRNIKQKYQQNSAGGRNQHKITR